MVSRVLKAKSWRYNKKKSFEKIIFMNRYPNQIFIHVTIVKDFILPKLSYSAMNELLRKIKNDFFLSNFSNMNNTFFDENI
jgi:hypothetical protein